MGSRGRLILVRPNPRLRMIDRCLQVLGPVVIILYFWMRTEASLVPFIIFMVVWSIGSMICATGPDTYLEENGVKRGFIRLRSGAIRHVDTSAEDRVVVTSSSNRNYEFRKRNYHPEDWLDLKGRLENLGEEKNPATDGSRSD